jgi:hypothetical protein
MAYLRGSVPDFTVHTEVFFVAVRKFAEHWVVGAWYCRVASVAASGLSFCHSLDSCNVLSFVGPCCYLLPRRELIIHGSGVLTTTSLCANGVIVAG